MSDTPARDAHGAPQHDALPQDFDAHVADGTDAANRMSTAEAQPPAQDEAQDRAPQAEAQGLSQAERTAGDDPATGAQAALDALVSDEGIREVDAPSQEALTSEMPPLQDIPDDAGAAVREFIAPDDPYDHANSTFTQDAAVQPVVRIVDAPAGAPDTAGDGGTGAAASATRELDHIEAAAVAAAASPSQTMPFAPVKPTSRDSASASGRISGAARAKGALAWGSRTDVGRVRPHNEDSYLVHFPLFAVADGMGGHAAGEVASTMAVSSLAESSLTKPSPEELGAAIEKANLAVLDGVERGVGRPGMGTTCSAVVIGGSHMAVGHVGDSRVYLLHEGKLLRVTHDHSFVEELVEAGEITPEEARVHPSRSIITRALGSDPNMKADAFMIDVTTGDRVLLCSDGLSSMVPDDAIEEAMVTSPAPQACADRLVDLALDAGGLDNVTAVVVDVKDDGIERHALRNRFRNVALWLLVVAAVLAVISVGMIIYADNTWYLSDEDGYVTLNQGIPGSYGPFVLSHEVERTSILTSDLSEAVEERLGRGITFGSEDDARALLEQYRAQIAQRAGEEASSQSTTQTSSPADTMSADGAATSAAGEGE